MNAKQASLLAADYLNQVIPGIGAILVEEIEVSEDKATWYITLSYENPPPPGVPVVVGFGRGRSYKIFKIAADPAEVLSMKIGEIK